MRPLVQVDIGSEGVADDSSVKGPLSHNLSYLTTSHAFLDFSFAIRKIDTYGIFVLRTTILSDMWNFCEWPRLTI